MPLSLVTGPANAGKARVVLDGVRSRADDVGHEAGEDLVGDRLADERSWHAGHCSIVRNSCQAR